ncbi:transglycosylase SLT domain-containing protein [Acetobacter pasteurianus]|uniref:Transglycosylase SLT domain-containing protein n=1 Tax=Acetobacter pasteurianus NBRC 3188 TaxID=1226663 RepID=A0A401WXU3_ACEPA|nr:transglycosylase SLT domain-containing protein [Acetobacter pasteurianus]GCD54141.1 hypothetical protein NBRC3188_2838 [Acetobacter pasteurianus NBRC 3188]
MICHRFHRRLPDFQWKAFAFGFLSLFGAFAPHTLLAKSPEAMRCIAATSQAERSLHIPDGFLSAMSRVETSKPDPDGTLAPWPWTVNAGGVGYHYASREEAIEAVYSFKARGINSIDVGCMQVNIMHHPDAFSSLENAFDPLPNSLYAGRFLIQMYSKMGSWPKAAAAYHSQTPGVGEPYQWKVLEEWSKPQDGRANTDGKPHPFHELRTNLASIHPTTKPRPMFVSKVEKDGNLDEEQTHNNPTPHPVKMFRPFKGNQKFSEINSPKHFDGLQKGRTLASYRAMPVRITTTFPVSSAVVQP